MSITTYCFETEPFGGERLIDRFEEHGLTPETATLFSLLKKSAVAVAEILNEDTGDLTFSLKLTNDYRREIFIELIKAAYLHENLEVETHQNNIFVNVWASGEERHLLTTFRFFFE